MPLFSIPIANAVLDLVFLEPNPRRKADTVIFRMNLDKIVNGYSKFQGPCPMCGF